MKAAPVRTVLVMIGSLCWVVADRHRSSHLAKLIRALRRRRDQQREN
ncbi:hypothetical protein ACIBHY_52470 [Nonomuraea sp. NPDC050547]